MTLPPGRMRNVNNARFSPPAYLSGGTVAWGIGDPSSCFKASVGTMRRRYAMWPAVCYARTPRELTSPRSPMLSKMRQSGQYHLVVRAGISWRPTHSR